MFIAIVGTRLSGRSCIENYLVSLKGFTLVRILDSEATVVRNISSVSLTASRSFRIISSQNHASLERDPPLSLEEALPSDTNSNGDGDSIVGFLNDHTGRIDGFSFLSMGSPKKGPTRIPLEIHWEKDPQQPLCFSSHAQLLDHVTRNWRSNFVTLDLDTRIVLEKFAKRPFFLLISVDAPLLERYRRSKRFVHSFVRGIRLCDVIAKAWDCIT
jgi:dCMP deaminase